ncbi:uncharacterized protein stmnd1 isoform X2 [Mobula birostris]|uniref:uncharacterized protein stmnd1 isoform X2 n=1 Tax=Mobula birostris TaxID=1983395 RepID=UPI003B284A1A
MGCGTFRAVSAQSEVDAEDSLERKRQVSIFLRDHQLLTQHGWRACKGAGWIRTQDLSLQSPTLMPLCHQPGKIKNNWENNNLNIIDDLPRSKVSENESIPLPRAAQRSLPPLRKANGTILRNGFNDDLALTASSLLKKNGPINEIRERPRSAEILQELLVQGILNQSQNEEWQEAHTPLLVVKATVGVLKKLPSRLAKIRNETIKQDNVTIEDIENKMMAEDERKKMKEVKLKEGLNKFNSSVLTIKDQSTGKLTVPDSAKMEENIEEVTIAQKEIQQEMQEVLKGEESNDEVDASNEQENKVNSAQRGEAVELDDAHYLTRQVKKVIANTS